MRRGFAPDPTRDAVPGPWQGTVVPCIPVSLGLSRRGHNRRSRWHRFVMPPSRQTQVKGVQGMTIPWPGSKGQRPLVGPGAKPQLFGA